MRDPTWKATVCPQCGVPAAPGEGFCRNCGKQLPAPTMTAPPPAIPSVQAPPAYVPPAKRRRSPLMLGCLIIIGVIVVTLGAGGIYVWRRTSYTPPVRTANDVPQRSAA